MEVLESVSVDINLYLLKWSTSQLILIPAQLDVKTEGKN